MMTRYILIKYAKINKVVVRIIYKLMNKVFIKIRKIQTEAKYIRTNRLDIEYK